MLTRDRLARDGAFLFRWRSFVPLIFLPLLVLALPEEQRVSAAMSPEAEHSVFYFSVLVSFLGLAIRWITVGFVPPGTSGRNTLSQRANELNTTGMYSIMRNPLYAGNLIAILGVLICVKVWWLIAIFVPCYWLYIERVVAAEEAYLEGKFGDAYREWVSQVPAFLPRFAHWQPPNRPFSLPFLLRREYNGLLAIGASFVVLELMLDVFVQQEPLSLWLVEDFAWVALGTITLTAFLTLRFLKTRTRLLNG